MSRSLLFTLAVCAAQPLAAQQQAPELRPAEGQAHQGVVPVSGRTSASTWTKPLLPQAPRPKLPSHKVVQEIPEGPPTWFVNTPPIPTPAINPAQAPVTIAANHPCLWSGQSRSDVSEPSVAQWGSVALLTHNWDAGVSPDSGKTWVRRDPRAFGSLDGGFCCDQYVLKIPGKHEQLIHTLQYGYSSTTKKGSYRIVVYSSLPGLLSGVSHSYAFSPKNAGWPDGYWLDYPSVTYTDEHFYFTANVYPGDGTNLPDWGVVCFRLRLDDMKAGRSVRYGSFRAVRAGQSWRLANGGSDSAYWWKVRSSTGGTVYRWEESKGAPTSMNVTHGAFGTGDKVFRDAVGNNFMKRADARPMAGWVGRDEIGFQWMSAAMSSRPNPFVRTLVLHRDTLRLKSEYDTWSSSLCVGYPSAAVNARGDAGGTMLLAASNAYPSTIAWIRDELGSQVPGNDNATMTQSSISSGEVWGDYTTTSAHPTLKNSFVATGMYKTVGIGMIPTYAHFGRSRDLTQKPDLFAADIGASTTTLRPEATVTLTASIENVGDTTAGSSRASFRLSADNVISTSDQLLDSWTTSSLASLGTVRVSRSVTVPDRQSASADCWLGLITDDQGQVSESNEGNNTASLRVRCERSTTRIWRLAFSTRNVVANIGDADGDGYEDFAVTNPDASTTTGVVRVFSGRSHAQMTSWQYSDGRKAGYSVAGGDLDGDGLRDMLVGAPGASGNNGGILFDGGASIRTGARAVRWFAQGSSSEPRLGERICVANLDAAANPDVAAVGRDVLSAWSSTGRKLWSVKPAPGTIINGLDTIGDVNGDGYDDLIIGMPSYLSGRGRWETRSGRDGALLRSWDGSAGEQRGGAVCGVGGDVDGDGVFDFVSASPPYNGVGLVQFWSGRTGQFIRSRWGPSGNKLWGRSVSRIGDYNGDGYVDVLVGAKGYVAVMSGKDTSILRRIDRTSDDFGSMVAGLESNGDAQGDMLVAENATAAHKFDGFVKANPARWSSYGPTCAGTNGNLPRIGISGPMPRIGGSVTVTLSGARASSAAICRLAAGRTSLALDFLGMPGCVKLTDVTLINFVRPTTSAGYSVFGPMSIAPDPQYTGFKLTWQWLVLDPGGNAFGLTASDAAEMTVGAQ